MSAKKAGKKFFADIMAYYVMKMRGSIAIVLLFVMVIWLCDNTVRAFRVKEQRL